MIMHNSIPFACSKAAQSVGNGAFCYPSIILDHFLGIAPWHVPIYEQSIQYESIMNHSIPFACLEAAQSVKNGAFCYSKYHLLTIFWG
jgi:hypothetical protein